MKSILKRKSKVTKKIKILLTPTLKKMKKDTKNKLK